MLKQGQLVTIASQHAGTCPGEVLHVEEPANLPSIYGAPEVDRVKKIMTEWGIVEVALISHLHNARSVMFVALRDSAGNWRDLKGQPLTITTRETP